MEPRKDAKYEVEISTPNGTLVSLADVDYGTAYTACKVVQESVKDEKLLEMLERCMRSFGFSGAYGEGYGVNISAYLAKTDTGEKHTCGRRNDLFAPGAGVENADTWELIGKDKVCSYCGSLHPDRVLELAKEHGISIIERSTKSYKWYVYQPNVPNALFGGIKYYRHHDTPEFIETFNGLLANKPTVADE